MAHGRTRRTPAGRAPQPPCSDAAAEDTGGRRRARRNAVGQAVRRMRPPGG